MTVGPEQKFTYCIVRKEVSTALFEEREREGSDVCIMIAFTGIFRRHVSTRDTVITEEVNRGPCSGTVLCDISCP